MSDTSNPYAPPNGAPIYISTGTEDSSGGGYIGNANAPTQTPQTPPQRVDMTNPYAPIAVSSALMAASDQADQQQAQQNASSPSLARLASPQPSGSLSTSQIGSGQDVWVTVPVDKIEVGASGKGTVTPVYAQSKGYASPKQGNNIPPVSTTGTRGVPTSRFGQGAQQ